MKKYYDLHFGFPKESDIRCIKNIERYPSPFCLNCHNICLLFLFVLFSTDFKHIVFYIQKF